MKSLLVGPGRLVGFPQAGESGVRVADVAGGIVEAEQPRVEVGAALVDRAFAVLYRVPLQGETALRRRLYGRLTPAEPKSKPLDALLALQLLQLIQSGAVARIGCTQRAEAGELLADILKVG